MEFTWDQTQTAWLLQQGPEAQCRTVTTGVLKKDPVSGFWDYTETQTHDDVMIPGKNVSCKKFDRTFRYTWRTTPAPLSCLFVQSLPD
jgi:hypothetical protein